MTIEKLNIEIEVNLGDEFFRSLFVTMVEGGCNYWAGRILCCDSKGEEISRTKEESYDVWMWNTLKSGGKVVLLDIEDPKTNYSFNKSSLLEAIKTWAKNRTEFFDTCHESIEGKELLTIDGTNIDIDEADYIIQHACFGKLVLG